MHHKPWGMNPCCPKKQVVYPTNCCVKNNYSCEEVDHIHPTHTTFVNHHHVNNKHFFPQSTSVVNTASESTEVFPPAPAPAPVMGPTPFPGGPFPGGF